MPISDAASTGASHAVSTLTIDLDAVAANYRALRDRAAPARAAAVVKADGYGLGAIPVTRRLSQEGCRTFFTATLDEGLALRAAFPDVEIAVLNGLLPGEAADYAAHRLLPVLNDLGQIEAWAAHGRDAKPLPAAVHLDTGMSRLGLSPAERERLIAEPERLAGVAVRYLMSHLACADTPDHPLNRLQQRDFAAATARLPHAEASLAASSGIFLGRDWLFDLVRCGVALYGGQPVAGRPNPMAPVVRLDAVVLQLRDVDSPETVGYGATHRFAGPARLATVAVGYADGYFRSLSGRGMAYWGDTALPLVGRVSMDLITLDATSAVGLAPGDTVELIGPRYDINALAADAGTIGYEVLTGLGRRYRRRYRGATGERIG